MRVLNQAGDTDKGTLKLAYEEAFTFFGVREEEKQDAKHWNLIKQKVSEIMTDKIRGRTEIQRKFRGSGTTNWTNLIPRTHFKTYPRHIVNDQDKLNYLNEEVAKNGLSLDIYYEMIGVLKDFRKKDILKDPRELRFV